MSGVRRQGGGSKSVCVGGGGVGEWGGGGGQGKTEGEGRKGECRVKCIWISKVEGVVSPWS